MDVFSSVREPKLASYVTSPSLPSTSLFMPTPRRKWQMRMEGWGRCSCWLLELLQVKKKHLESSGSVEIQTATCFALTEGCVTVYCPIKCILVFLPVSAFSIR